MDRACGDYSKETEQLTMKTGNSLLTALVITAILCLAGLAAGLVVVYSGAVDISAVKPHYAVTKWVLETAMKHSVVRHARKVNIPATYPSSAIGDAFPHYAEMCAICHGGPGKQPSEIGKGLRPKPPDLAKVVNQLRDEEIFWIVKNGIRMTGMPAFGPTHKDSELWRMVALVKTFPEMTPEQYRQGTRKQKH